MGIAIPSVIPALVSANAAIPPAPLEVALALLVAVLLALVPPPAPVVLAPAPPAPPVPVLVVAEVVVSLPVDEVPVAVVVSLLEQAARDAKPSVSARSAVRAFMGATLPRRAAPLV
jgi:hypothetical protein